MDILDNTPIPNRSRIRGFVESGSVPTTTEVSFTEPSVSIVELCLHAIRLLHVYIGIGTESITTSWE